MSLRLQQITLRLALLLLAASLLTGCSVGRILHLDNLRGEPLKGEMADYGSDLRTKTDDDSGLTGMTTRGRQIERNLGL